MMPPRRPTLRSATVAAALAAAALLSGCGQDSPETLTEKAKAALASRDLKAAAIHLMNVLQQRPDDAEARLMLAGVHAAGRDLRSAEKELARALELGAAPDRVVPTLVETRLQLGDAKRALAAATAWRPDEPRKKAEAAYWRGRSLAALGQSDEADGAYREALSHDPDHPRAQVALIARRAASGDLQGAHAAVDALLARAPALLDALMLKAELQIARRDIAGARDTLAKAIDADPAGAAARIRLVGLLVDTRDLDAAEVQHAQLARLAPGLPQTTFLKAQIEFRRGRYEAALIGAQNVLKVAPDFAPALALAASVSLAKGSLEQAESYTRQLAARTPDSVVAQRLLAAVHLRKNDSERALQTARSAIDRGARDPLLFQIAGEAALRRNDLALATDLFEQASKLDPRNTASRTGLGLAQLSSGRSEQGFGTLESAAELDPDTTQADLALIAARMGAKQYDQALAAIARLERKQAGAALPHNLRGTVLLAQGDPANARASFERAAALDPTFFPAAANLARIERLEGRIDDAKKRLRDFTQRAPTNVRGWLAYAELVAETGGTDEEAVALIAKAQAADPLSVEPALALARLHVRGNRPRDAIAPLQRSLQQHPDDRMLLDALATASLLAGDKEQARSALEKLARLDPGSAATLLRTAELRAALGDRPGAIASLRRAADVAPQAFELQVRLAALLLEDGRADDARRLAADLQRSQPRRPEGLMIEGDVHAAAGRWREAASLYSKAQGIERTTPLAIRLHRALVRAGRPADAEAALQADLRALQNDVALRAYAGEQALAAKQWRAAADQYVAIVRIQPWNVVALNNLAWTLRELKDPEAIRFAERAYERAPASAAVVNTYGAVLFDRGDRDRGLDLLRKATNLAPRAPDYRLHYAQALASGGDAAGAKREIARIVADFPDSPAAATAQKLAARL